MYTTVESQPNQFWVLVDIQCTSQLGSTVTPNLDTNSVAVNMKLGDVVTCTFINGLATRSSQGYWATHFVQATDYWDNSAGNRPAGSPTVVSLDLQLQCGAFDVDDVPKMEGGFWSGISQEFPKGKRTDVDQARMQLAQQYEAAVLNNVAFGSSPGGTVFADANAAFCGSDKSSMLSYAGILDIFNTGGGGIPFPDGFINTPADKKGAEGAADKAYWNQPTLPGFPAP